MTEDEIVAAFRARVAAGEFYGCEVIAGKVSVARPRLATDQDISDVEAAAGYPMPRLLSRLYREVAAGQFGPGFDGIIGFPAWNSEGSIFDWCQADRGEPSDGYTPIPQGVVGICDWGCAMYSAVNWRDEHATVWSINSGSLEPDDVTLAVWLSRWLEGWNDKDGLHWSAPENGVISRPLTIPPPPPIRVTLERSLAERVRSFPLVNWPAWWRVTVKLRDGSSIPGVLVDADGWVFRVEGRTEVGFAGDDVVQVDDGSARD